MDWEFLVLQFPEISKILLLVSFLSNSQVSNLTSQVAHLTPHASFSYFYANPRNFYQMDINKLKGRPSFPFETIGVAVAFSPRLEEVLGEAKQLAHAFGAQLLLMHIGERTRNKEAKLDEIISKLGIDEKKTRVIWHEGNPVITLLELCKLNIVDLLVLGAMQKENVLRYYLGSVARRISRKAKCSVLLLTEPKKEGTRFKKIIVNGVENAKTVHTINTAVYFGKHLNTKQITVATETHQPGLAMTMASESTAVEASKIRKEFSEEEMNKVHDMVTNVSEREGIEIMEKQIKGKPGYAIRQYAATKKADLLVINSPDLKYGIIDRIFTHDMEYILEDLPANVLIVHSRVTETK
jgi:nucleotide-binding universal stress UspA family protein